VTAGINISIGWIFGRWAFTQLNHCDKPRRYVAFLFVPVLFVCAAVLYNLFIGHFRDALATIVTADSIEYREVGRDVWDSVWSNPLGLQSFDSWLLVFLGIVFCLIAAADGYNFDDPYPGYGKVARRYDRARLDYINDKHEFLGDLDDLREEFTDEIKSTKLEVETQSRSINDIITLTKKRENEFDAYMHDLNNKCTHVLQLYRTSNAQSRKTEPPEYFGEPYTVSKDTHLPKRDTLDLSELQSQLKNVDGLLQKVSDVRLELERTYSRSIDKLSKELEEIEA
jgi:hypothetical protein